MEGKPEAQLRPGEHVHCEREPEEDECKPWPGGQSQSNKVPWTHIRYTGRSIKGVAMNLTAELGPIQIRNGSIVIPCDGLYLVSLKSSIYLEEENWLKLTLRGTHETSSALWEQIVQSSDRTVNLTTVLYLFQQDSITLWTNSNASIRDLSFSLVLISDNKC
ncbi:hypothetical protein HGM15179_009293 [Zosterops borbonicus]|uniref:TNF family profile domain-containing protein n=1 Tax=Zosterops borbonicus TaxID=364589 RepID=A0A8K1LL51_9PASS|nr:hypothetical protein HGM15179_009293 [Zosterops borbonicus]